MAEDDHGKSGAPTNLRESYQTKVEKTYTPRISSGRAFDSYTPNVVAGRNYQPVLPITGSAGQSTPPTGGSGVPPAGNNGSPIISSTSKKSNG